MVAGVRPRGTRRRIAFSPTSRSSKRYSLLLGTLRRRDQRKVEIAGLERIFVVAQRRIVRRQRHGKTSRQPAIEQSGAFQFLEPRQIAKRFEAEMGEERFVCSVGDRP